MGSEPAIVEISSDDEEDLSMDELDSFNWVADMLDRTDGRLEEVDDVVVVDEFSSAPPAKQKKNSESLRPGMVAAGDESDDDCLMLDSDPNNPVSVVDKGDGGDGSDDLLIVGEKGQLACRDFPHPRHLCANFPFSTTSHEKHCNLCHCYVCDSPAPCIYWGNGSASTDHCHSTDKDGRWKSLRQSSKQKNLTTSQPQKLPDRTLSMMPSFQNSAPLRCSNMSSLPIPTSRSIPLRPCSAARCATPDPPNQRHQQNTAPLSYSGQRLGHHPSKSHPLNPRAKCIQRQIHVSRSITAQLEYSRSRFKRVRTARANRFQRNVPQRSHFTILSSQRSHCPPVTSQRSQCSRVTSQKSQCLPVTPPQRSNSAPVTSQISQCPSVTSVDDNVNQMYRTAPQRSQHVPAISQCPPMTPVNDNMKSWLDILASVASELGVSDGNSRDAVPAVQEPVLVSSQPLPFSQFVSETSASQDVDLYGRSAPEVTNMNSLEFDCRWLNPAAQSIQENDQEVDPQLTNVRPSDSLVSGSKQDPGETPLGSFLASLEEIAETAKEPGQPELDPVTLLYDFEATWSGLAPV
ncbi:uncharacterized protein LOC103715432 [Phoenix dactylifera]|uniref:Uncharacterized protein LOC103715432 n=1 Tax=Phoenix dactylifera TaxID=42345 RepID=A0A8B8ZNV5_PHODC|nr:uncharacterized protein LOC103715432 [Phoenix dactylifera]